MEQKRDEIFKKVAQKLGWQNYEIDSDLNQLIGNGFMSEMFFASIKNKDSGEIVDLAFKSAFSEELKRGASNTKSVFHNEITFYDVVIPKMLKFVKDKGVKEEFDFLVKYFASIKDEGFEIIALENIKSLGFQLVDRQEMLDEEHVKFVFETYGKYHGLSFAYKDQNPGEFQGLMKQGIDLFQMFDENTNDKFGGIMTLAFQDGFANVDEKIRETCKDYLENAEDVHISNLKDTVKSEYQCMLHGDCWSNNMMFKYKDSKVVAMKLLDFQLLCEGSPVRDLSYFLYAGAPYEIYSNLDQYLKIYHDSLSKTLSSLGSDPEKVFPWEALKTEWKKYSKIGIVSGLMINRVKLMTTDDAKEMAQSKEGITQLKLNDDSLVIFKERCKLLLEHSYKEGYLL